MTLSRRKYTVVNMNEKEYFLTPSTVAQKKYEALRAFFIDELPAKEIAPKFGYTYRAFTSLVAEFRNKRIVAITDSTNIELEKRVFLQTIDFLWRSHLQYLEHLRQIVGLRGYAQKDPLEEFKREAFKLFESLLNRIKIDFITFLNNLEIVTKTDSSEKKIDQKIMLY